MIFPFFFSSPLLNQSPSSNRSSAHTLPVQWWMCTAAACGQWNSTVYTYHIHLINPNEVSTGLLFTMHCWAAAARHGATTHIQTYTHAFWHAYTPAAPPSAVSAESQFLAREREARCFLGAEVILPSDHRQADPWGSIWLKEEEIIHSIVYTDLCSLSAQPVEVRESHITLSELLHF